MLSASYFAQALAHSRLALAPASAGLVIAIAGSLLYPLFGSRPRLTFGPGLGVCAIVGATLAEVPAVHRATSLAALSVMVAGFHWLAACFELGFLQRLFPESVRVGYLAGTGVTIVIAQVAELASAGQISLALGLASIAVLLASRRLGLRVMAPFLAILLAVSLSVAFDVSRRGVPVIGDSLGELGRWTAPAGLDARALSSLLASALAIAFHSQVDLLASSERLPRPGGLGIRSRRESWALGIVNLVAGLFGGFPAGCNTPRVPLDMPARYFDRRVTALAGALLAVAALSMPDLLRTLPLATLTGLLVVAAVELIDARRLQRLWQLQRADYRMALLTAFGVVLAGPRWGVGIGVVVALLESFRTASARERTLRGAPAAASMAIDETDFGAVLRTLRVAGRTSSNALPRERRQRHRWVLASWPPRGRTPRRGRAVRD